MIDIVEAILKINPTAEVSVDDKDINKITWLNGTTPISKSDIEAIIPTVEAEQAQAKLDAVANKTSATNKLKALGLTDAEIGALKT